MCNSKFKDKQISSKNQISPALQGKGRSVISAASQRSKGLRYCPGHCVRQAFVIFCDLAVSKTAKIRLFEVGEMGSLKINVHSFIEA
jgi:hypothetical protein